VANSDLSERELVANVLDSTRSLPHAFERALEATLEAKKILGACSQSRSERSRRVLTTIHRAIESLRPGATGIPILGLSASPHRTMRCHARPRIHVDVHGLPQLTYPTGSTALAPQQGGYPHSASPWPTRSTSDGLRAAAPPPGFAPPAMWGQPQAAGDTASHRWIRRCSYAVSAGSVRWICRRDGSDHHYGGNISHNATSDGDDSDWKYRKMTVCETCTHFSPVAPLSQRLAPRSRN